MLIKKKKKCQWPTRSPLMNVIELARGRLVTTINMTREHRSSVLIICFFFSTPNNRIDNFNV